MQQEYDRQVTAGQIGSILRLSRLSARAHLAYAVHGLGFTVNPSRQSVMRRSLPQQPVPCPGRECFSRWELY